MRRIVVIGTSGSGKTTLARELSDRLGISHVELDSLFHRPGWTEAPTEEFRQDVIAALAAAPDGWVTCGNYGSRLDKLHWADADTIVWLDLPRYLTMWRLVRRTLIRVLWRRELWGGNREQLSGLWHRDGILRFAWRSHARNLRDYEGAIGDPRWSHATWVRLRSPREVRAWLDRVSPAGGAAAS